MYRSACWPTIWNGTCGRTWRRSCSTLPVHSFRTLLADLATLTRNVVRLGDNRFDILLAAPTKVQRTAFDLLNVSPVA
jgi:hypothetical protein